MIERICVLGLGKLGSCIAAAFAKAGIHVTGYDIDLKKVSAINSGQAPVQEPGLQEAITQCRKYLLATTDPFLAVRGTQACIFVAPTPSLPDGSFHNTYLLEGIAKIATAVSKTRSLAKKNAVQEPYIFVIASTVTPGTCQNVLIPAVDNHSKGTRVVYKPELIALGSVMANLAKPDIALIGADNLASGAEIVQLYSRIHACEFRVMGLLDAELAKISLNCAITMKISFANQVGMLADDMGADARTILDFIGRDSRIGSKCLKYGMAFGGPCVLPDALVQTSQGLQRMDTLETGDRVLSHDGKYHAVTQIYRRPYAGDLIRISAEGFASDPLVLTPEHPVWSRIRISSIANRHYTTRGVRRLAQMVDMEPLAFNAAMELQVGDVLALPQISTETICPVMVHLHKSNIGRPSPAAGIHSLDEKLAYTFGWYLSEGSSWQKEIKLSLHKDEEAYANQIGQIWAEKFGVTTEIKTRKGNGLGTRTTCAPLAQYLRDTFGRHSYDKCVPPEWINLPVLELKALLRGMWYGDGSNSENEFSWATTSLDLFNFMKLAFLRLAIPFTTKKPGPWTGRDGVKHRCAYFLCVRNPAAYQAMNELLPDLKVRPGKGRKTVWFEQGTMLYHIKKVETLPYDGEVFNLEVETAESYVLEGGTVHNCFPRDNRMFQFVSEQRGIIAYMSRATDTINDDVRRHLLGQVPRDGDVGILGLAYKSGTSVTEEATGTWLKNVLAKKGRKVKAHDPLIAPHGIDDVLACPTIIVTLDYPEYRTLRIGAGKCVIDPMGILETP